MPLKDGACKNDVCNAANGLPYTTYGLAGLVKTFAIIAGLFAVVSVGCAAPPYVPQPPPVVTNFVSLAFTLPADTNVAGVRIYATPASSTTASYTLFRDCPVPLTVAQGVLTNQPPGTIWQ